MQTTIKFTAQNFRKMIRRNITPKQVGPNVWSVNSTSNPSRAYLIAVTMQGNLLDVRCGCLAGQNNKGCAHALAVVHAINADTRLIPRRKAA